MNTSDVAKRFFELNQEAHRIEKELSELKERLKNAGSGHYGEFVVAIELRERESFSIKEAKEHMTSYVWNKIKSFVRVTTYQQIKVVKA